MKTMKILKKSCDNYESNEIFWNPLENNENHKNHENTYDNYENHENQKKSKR